MHAELATECATGLDAGQQTTARIVASDTPALSWVLPAGMGTQGRFEVEAFINGVGAHHVAEGSQHLYVPWPWSPVKSRARVKWRVRVRGTDTNLWSDWSKWSAFEAPLFTETDWRAQWIAPTESDAGHDRPAYTLEREFELDGKPDAARLYVTALGLYEAFINGMRVGDLELTPGSSSYDETLLAQAYDVSDLVHPGRNLLTLVLSDGWYRGRNGGPQRQNAWGATTAALAQLEVREGNTTRIVVSTDPSWSSRYGTITRADLMTGQTTDLSRPVTAPEPVIAGSVSPPLPTWSPAPAVRRIEELAPVSVTTINEHLTVVDFGQNISGWVRLTDLGTNGSVTELEFAEHVDPSGNISTSHLDTHTPEGAHLPYRQIDRVIAGAASDTFEPRHTVHGFRYARISHPGRTLDPGAVTAVVVHTDLSRTGWFECSDDSINRLHEAVVWSFRGNAVDVPTDCPTRERSGWTGDFQVFTPTAGFLFDIRGFARKWLQSLHDDQYDDGSPAMFSPDSERMKRSENPSRVGGGSAGWGDAAVLVPWNLYRTYGEPEVLEASWESMRAWIEFALRAARNGRHPIRVARSAEPMSHEQFIWDATFHFGEWLEPSAETSTDTSDVDPAAAYQAFLAADNGEIATAYLYHSTRILSDVARLTGRVDQAATYGQIADQVRTAWVTEFLGDDGRTTVDTQASYARSLAFGLIPENLVEMSARRLVGLVDAAGGHLTTGFLSTGLLLPTLADSGHATTAFELLLQRKTPSWLGMIDRGATTVWEDWDGVNEAGEAKASLNHYSKGAVVGFLYSHVAGLRQAPGSTGWERFTIAPLIGGGITHATARFLSPNGLIETGWNIDGNHLSFTATVPPGSTADVTLPDGTSTTLTPGHHQLSCGVPPSQTDDPYRTITQTSAQDVALIIEKEHS